MATDASDDDISDVDPEELMKSLQSMDMEDLDAGLFGKSKLTPKSTSVMSKPKTNPASQKKVNFSEKTMKKDFDIDDPLEGLLSDEDRSGFSDPKPRVTSTPPSTRSAIKRNTAPAAEKKKNPGDDKLFDDDDIMGSLGIDDSGSNKAKKSEPISVLDELLRPTSHKSANSKKPLNSRFDKDGNYVKDDHQEATIKSAAATTSQPVHKPPPSTGVTKSGAEPSPYGSYQPSASDRRDSKSAQPPGGADDFLSFLLGDDKQQNNNKPTSAKRDIAPRASAAKDPPSRDRSPAPRDRSPMSRDNKSPADFLGLGKELDISSILSDDRPSSSGSQRPTTLTQEPEQHPANLSLNNKPDPAMTSSLRAPRRLSGSAMSPLASGLNSPAPSSPVVTKPPAPLLHTRPTPSDSLQRARPQSAQEANLLGDLFGASAAEGGVSPSRVQTAPPAPQVDEIAPSPGQFLDREQTDLRQDGRQVPVFQPDPRIAEAITSQVGYDVTNSAHVQALRGQIEHLKAMLHESQLGYHADRELAQQANDGRVEILQRSLADLRSRGEREMESMRESYAVRLEAVREQAREHAREAAGRDVLEFDEIKRLRQFHLEAMDEIRKDADEKLGRVKKAHQDEIDALQCSSVFVRNMDGMMERVSTATDQLHHFFVKFESSFESVSSQSQEAVAANKHFLTVVQKQLNALERNQKESQSTLQQAISRFDGKVSEMNRRFEEQLFILQGEQTRLQNAQISLDEERKSLLQQVAAEREQNRKAQAEVAEHQQRNQREFRDERERFARKDDDLRRANLQLDEKRQAQDERATRREQEFAKAAEVAARDRCQLAERQEKAVALETRLREEHDDLQARLMKVKRNEDEIAKRSEVLKRKEAELELRQKEEAERMERNDKALLEARKIEEERSHHLRDIASQQEEVARQRQLLAEERKMVVEERILTGGFKPPSAGHKPGQYDVTPTKIEPGPKRQPLRMTTPSPDASALLWKHEAQQDRHFLEEEEFFLESLKHTPHHISMT